MTALRQQVNLRRLHRLPCAGKTLACLIAVMLTAKVSPASGQQPAPPIPNTLPIHLLSEEDKWQLKQSLQQAEIFFTLFVSLSDKFDNTSVPIDADGWIEFANTVVSLREMLWGESSWQSIDARRQVADLRRLAGLSAQQRTELIRARQLDLQGENLYATGKYEQAITLHQNAASIIRRILGEEHADYATSLNNLALLYHDQGRYGQAEPLLRQALEINRKVLGEEHPDYALTLSNLAFGYAALGRYEQADSLYRQAVTIVMNAFSEMEVKTLSLSQMGRIWQYHSIVHRYASLALNPGYEQARAEQMLESLSSNLELEERMLPAVDSIPEFLRTLSTLLSPTGRDADPEEQEMVSRSAQWVSVFLNNFRLRTSSTYASGLSTLADVYASQGRYAEAEPLYRQALAIQKKVLGEEHPDYATSLNNLAFVYDNQGRYEEAEPLYREAQAIRKKVLGEAHPDYATSLSDLAALLGAMGRFEEASGLLLSSARVTWRHLTRNFPTLSAEQKRQFLAHSSFLQSELLSGLIFQGHGVEAKAGLEGALLSKQLLFEAARQESGALLSAVTAAPPEWQAKWRERERLRRQFATLALQGMAEAGRAQQPGHKAVDPGYVRSLSERIEGLEQQLRQANPEYALGARLREVSLADVTGALRPGEALVEYVRYRPYDYASRKWGSGRYGAFLLPGDGGEVLAIDLGEAEAIDQAVRRFQAEVRASIEQFGSIEPSRGQVRHSERKIALASSALRALVWQPLEEGLSGIGRVYVAPDGLLSLVPFEALARESESGGWRYLAEDRELIYLGTGRDLGRLALSAKLGTGRPSTAVLIGNPAFGAQPRELAAVVAGLQPTTLVARAASETGPSTLGGRGASQSQCQQIGSVGQVPALAALIQQAQGQLEGLGWSVTALTDQLAVEEAALAVQAPRILQFATHGLLLDPCDTDREGWDNPLLRSVLLMAGVNRWQADSRTFYRVGSQVLSEEQARARGMSQQALEAGRVELADGILTAYELTGMNLRGTDLVNLTACETGLGEVTPDGVVGLRQAFLLAGARSLTMSMWEVPAAETSRQIMDLYDHWLGGGTGVPASARYGAFRAAQLSALARARQDHGVGHPFYWAGVVFVGDPGDLPAVP